ncbi:hypothetical protein NDU88_002748 [Pleurodeles waltl]|uniref:Uncharacterized protein n=1 Tax=Pleurodeles waltl TaxID=8319 RepID=A0AAV7UWH1_PLEWA|nr:hypothetical protein NDU88_002748 [Pleurodeles waltl]
MHVRLFSAKIEMTTAYLVHGLTRKSSELVHALWSSQPTNTFCGYVYELRIMTLPVCSNRGGCCMLCACPGSALSASPHIRTAKLGSNDRRRSFVLRSVPGACRPHRILMHKRVQTRT